MTATAAVAVTTPGIAQDFSIGGTSPMDFSAMSTATMNNAIGNLSVGETARAQRGPSSSRAAPSVGTSPVAAAFAAPGRDAERAGPVAPRQLTYRIEGAVRQQVVRDFQARLAARNRALAAGFDTMVKRQDPFGAFRGMVGDLGLRTDNAADALAAYLVTAWIVASGREVDPDPAGTRLIRGRIAAAMLANPRLSDPATLQRLGDELQILTVVIAAGWNGAKSEGRTRGYSDQVAAMVRGFGGPDLQRYDLTARGFVRR